MIGERAGCRQQRARPGCEAFHRHMVRSTGNRVMLRSDLEIARRMRIIRRLD